MAENLSDAPMQPLSVNVADWAESASQLGKTIVDLTRDAMNAPGRLGQAGQLLTGGGAAGSVPEVLFAFALMLICAIGVACLVGLALRSQRHRLRLIAPPFELPSAFALLRAGLVDAAPPAAYLIAGLGGADLLFSDHGLVFHGSETFQSVLAMAVTTSSIVWFASVFLSLPLGVGRPGLRLFPIDETDAAVLRSFIRHVLLLGGGSWTAASGLYYCWIGEGLPRLIMVAAGLLAGAMCVRGLARAWQHLVGFGKVWAVLAVSAVIGLTAIWVVALLSGRLPPFRELLETVLVLIGVAAADGTVSLALVRFRRHLAAGKILTRRFYEPRPDSEDQPLVLVEEPAAAHGSQAIAAEMGRAAGELVDRIHEALHWGQTIVVVLLLAHFWSVDLGALLGPAGARTWFGSVVDAGFTLLAGWYIWILFDASLAFRLSREEGGPQSRARTIQPLLHAIGRLVIGAVAVMSALSSLGANIAPLLASAGVIGIAVGFGAQTLVRDLFSGACYLIEDVFRVGDYIEGGSAKGVVERITFRTVALRHQNGPLYFVPYGSLGVVRNNSRDWVIDKFEIPLPHTVQSERVRKLVKKVGQEMLEDEALAKLMVGPLKAKLLRIEPGVKVFRCKFQTLPERQFELRTEAYRRLEAALAEAEIPFADSTSRIAVYPGTSVALQAVA
ncbi:MAG: mechanosensitive ion channel [Alphaproteobacteria bacterium]|nr:mechanosensitive ion channel [Alphaproteobacteria bacterium]